MLEDLAAEERIDNLIADRGYTFSKGERWAQPLRDAGVDLAFDLHPAQRGTKGTFGGAVQVDGDLYCPAMPEALYNLEHIDEFTTKKRREELFAEYERRDTFLIRPLGKDKPGKPRRVRCPAAAGVARCPIKPDSLNLPYHYPTVYPDQGLQAAPPTCCSQTTMSVPVEIQSSTRQNHSFGTREWFDAYSRLRPAVESFFSMVKDAGKEHMSRGRIKMMGIAKTSIMVAFYTASVNFRLVDAYDREQEVAALRAANGHVVTPRKPRRHRAQSIQYQLNRASGTDPPGKQPATV